MSIDLYGTHNDRAGNGRAAVLLAAEYLLATLYALNAAEAADGSSSRYNRFAAQWWADSTTSPFQATSDALMALWMQLAVVDGFSVEECRDVAERASNAAHDLIGEHDPATRAYAHAVQEQRAWRLQHFIRGRQIIHEEEHGATEDQAEARALQDSAGWFDLAGMDAL